MAFHCLGGRIPRAPYNLEFSLSSRHVCLRQRCSRQLRATRHTSWGRSDGRYSIVGGSVVAVSVGLLCVATSKTYFSTNSFISLTNYSPFSFRIARYRSQSYLHYEGRKTQVAYNAGRFAFWFHLAHPFRDWGYQSDFLSLKVSKFFTSFEVLSSWAS